MTLTAKEFSAPPEIFKSARTTAIQHQGPFTLHFNLPGQCPRRNRPWLWTVSPDRGVAARTRNLDPFSSPHK